MKSWIVRVVLLATVVLGLPSAVRAQEIALAGTVTDSTDAVLPGATITALHIESGNTFVAVTDASGQFRIGAMRAGVHKVTVELPGFVTTGRENLELLVGQRAVINFKMTLATVQESVTVTGEAPLIDVSQSKMGGNVDPRQLQELPVNGRNWMDLTMLAPGSRNNAVTDSPNGSHGGFFQLNVDGQQVTSNIACARWGEPKFSRDAIAEFEFVSARFDATQGRSSGVQVNVVTKSGTNNFGGTFSGYFRSDTFNAEDFIVHRVLPYSDQQISGTFGGPIVQNKAHFFFYMEGERNPQSFTFTSAYPAFNIAPLTGVNTDKKIGVRFDQQMGSATHLMVRSNGWKAFSPYTDPSSGGSTGGATLHPSRASFAKRSSGEFFASLTRTLGQKAVNILKPGFSTIYSFDDAYVHAPQILLRGYTIGTESFKPLGLQQHSYSLRDDFTYVKGRQEMKIGADFIYHHTYLLWSANRFGSLQANGGPIPANVESLFPVWNDPSTWNLAALSPITVRWQQAIPDPNGYNSDHGPFTIIDPQENLAAWLQDNWTLGKSLTLNLGVRWDVYYGGIGEGINHPPFRSPQPHDLNNIAPRLGFAWTLPDTKTVVRGGFGQYYQGLTDQPSHHSIVDLIAPVPSIVNDGRPNFAADPFNGNPPTYEQVLNNTVRDVNGTLASPNLDTPWTYQTSMGLERQVGSDSSFQADYVWSAGRHELSTRNINLTYDPATGVNYRFSDPTTRPYPTWGIVGMRFSDATSNRHALETAFTKRMSHHWQFAATYTLSKYFDNNPPVPINPGCVGPMSAPGVCNVLFNVAPDLGGEYGLASAGNLAAGDQRHRAVFNGIWEMPYGFQLSGLYFYGSGERYSTSYGADLRDSGNKGNRLTPNGSIVSRNALVGDPIHRVDMRVQRRFPIARTVKIDGMFEVFNLFNHANYGAYTTATSSAAYGKPAQNTALAYAPRMLQLGFRLTF